MAFGKIYQFTALCFGLSAAPQVFTWVMAPVSEFLHSLGFGFGLICTTGYSGVLPRVGSSFSEDGPPVVQFSRNSRQLREVSACVASEDVSSSESYWTLSVSGLLQPRNKSTSFSQLAPCFYHEWIHLRNLRVDEDAVLSDPAHSGGAAADAVVPVCPSLGLGPLRFRNSCAVVFGIRQDLFWWLDHERLELVSSLGRVSPQLDLWSDSSDVGWALISILFWVPSGP